MLATLIRWYGMGSSGPVWLKRPMLSTWKESGVLGVDTGRLISSRQLERMGVTTSASSPSPALWWFSSSQKWGHTRNFSKVRGHFSSLEFAPMFRRRTCVIAHVDRHAWQNKTAFQTIREQHTQTRLFAPVTLTLTRWPWYRNTIPGDSEGVRVHTKNEISR